MRIPARGSDPKTSGPRDLVNSPAISVNIFHCARAIKVDLFVMGESPLDEEQMNRRLRVQVTTAPDRYLYAIGPHGSRG